MIVYSDFETTTAEPEASSMIETFRAIGYSLETAVADIIDNSITAGAKNIWVDYVWAGSNTVFSILDDGIGMNNEQLIQAMRPGSKNPLEERSIYDLGRFGLGLKTASFSQSKKFTVFSKSKGYKTIFWSWDLDYVNEVKSWKIIRFHPDSDFWIEKINAFESGTCVVWWDLDRLTNNTAEDSLDAKSKFLATMNTVKLHLSMVFHRFIEDGLNIYFRGRKIEPWDPFMIGVSSAIQPQPEAVYEGGLVKIKGFVLPHRSKLTPEQYNIGKGPKDSWTAHQGFYVYRNQRLLVSGDWLGLFKKEHHYDLCRIRIDLPNKFDSNWQIDIKKSIARPPATLKDKIISVANDVRNKAVGVYRHKGQVIKRELAQSDYHPFWQELVRHNKRFYKINRSHPLISDFLNKSGDFKHEVVKILQFIEETIPVPLITLQESESESPHGQPFEGTDLGAIKDVMRTLFKSFLNDGISVERAKARVLSIEPFNHYPELVEFIENDQN